jgi:7,8-dihydropterin-6-yl-methyl-4-(beta-D-ribofuranosyl)aminobenzene 5'-phosphate synthase
MRVTLLAENTAQSAGLTAEHGIAWWIELGTQRVLFDTGQGMVLGENARQLKLPLDRVDAIVLSHGHYDHTGGLLSVVCRTGTPVVYTHPAAFEPKYVVPRNGRARDVGIPAPCREALQTSAAHIVKTDRPTPVVDGLIATGPIPRRNAIEDTGGPFYLDAEGQRPDPLLDDQAVYAPTPHGTIILLGCAHAGVINTIQYVRQLTDEAPIHMVLGGMHLVNASRERLQWTIDQLRALDVHAFAPMHCTGLPATAMLWNALPNQFTQASVGSRFEFETA